jgi:hypothetical protein
MRNETNNKALTHSLNGILFFVYLFLLQGQTFSDFIPHNLYHLLSLPNGWSFANTNTLREDEGYVRNYRMD